MDLTPTRPEMKTETETQSPPSKRVGIYLSFSPSIPAEQADLVRDYIGQSVSESIEDWITEAAEIHGMEGRVDFDIKGETWAARKEGA